MIDVLGPKKRRRRTTQEKIAIVQQSFEPGMTVALIARGWGVSLVSRCLRVSRAQLHVILRRTDDWMDGRRSRHTDDTDVLLRISSLRGCRTISTANRELSLTTMRIKRIRQHCCPVLNRPGKIDPTHVIWTQA